MALEVRLRGTSLSVYLDTSALIKLLVEETGSDLARSAYADANGVRTTMRYARTMPSTSPVPSPSLRARRSPSRAGTTS